MKDHWKLIAFVVVALSAAVLFGMRWRRGFGSPVPDRIQLREITSPSVTWTGSLRASWSAIEDVSKVVQGEVTRTGLPLGSLRLIYLADDAQNAVVWTTENHVNPGFAPLSRIELHGGVDTNRVIGFYTLHGQPLRYNLKRDPMRGMGSFATLLLDRPVTAGGTTMVFRVERRRDLVSRNNQNQLAVTLGEIPGPTVAVHARAIVLPPHARVSMHQPADGALVSDRNSRPVFNWINTLLGDAVAVLSIQFTLSGS